MENVIVLGGGPAGCVSALHLSRLGYQVHLIAQHRTSVIIEGLSIRVLEGLKNAGCVRAVALLGDPVPRTASWNGATSDANTEQLLSRREFDAALLADAQASGVAVTEGRIVNVRSTAEECRVQFVRLGGAYSEMRGHFLVEARGRRAPRSRAVATRGCPGLALSRRFENCAISHAGTWIASFPKGWAWFAGDDESGGSLQIIVDGARGSWARHSNLTPLFDALIDQIPEIQQCLGKNARAISPVLVRESTPYLHEKPISEGVIRVGDAAFGIDPLSGHGMFEAVGAGMAAAPVVHTILQRPRVAELARDFYRTRAREAFLRHARVGRDFYRSEQRWSDLSYWQTRRDWPDEVPAHAVPAGQVPRIQRTAVIENGFIERREVVVTANQPRGVRFIEGTPLVPLIDLIDGQESVDVKEGMALNWLRAQHIMGPDGLTVSAAQLRDNCTVRRRTE